MIVCSCHAVSDRTVRDAAARGATVEDIALATGAGSDCGVCHDEISSIVKERRSGPCRASPCAGCPRRAAA